MKRRIYLLFIIVLITGIPLSAQSVGETAPNFSVSLEGGGNFELSAHQGKVVMIFFFGNGCPYCISSGPQVQGIYNSHKNNPDFVAVGLDTWNSSSTEESVAGFRGETGISFPLAIKAGSVEDLYSTTYDRLAVVDQDGVLRHKGTVPAINDIDNTDAVIAGLLTPTSVATEKADKNVRVYPMPASDELNFSLSRLHSGIVGLGIFDISGKRVLHREISLSGTDSHFAIDVSKLPQGLYFYKLNNGENRETGKIIVKRQ